ncbi:hypothetical protein EFW58_01863 [Bacillus velezensis]|nr:hypothetical protein EFW58_01863 [Bacillus velezensis]
MLRRFMERLFHFLRRKWSAEKQMNSLFTISESVSSLKR